MTNVWMKWALAEAATKTASRILQKFVGPAYHSLAGATLAYLVIGFVQAFMGLFLSLVRRQTFLSDRRSIVYAAFFGLGASLQSVLSFYSFTFQGIDIGVVTFVVTGSIIPGVLIDHIFFGSFLNKRQWFGIAVFLAAGYAMLNFPTLTFLLNPPTWLWLTFIIMLSQASNEAFSRAVKDADTGVNNFWVGLATVVFCSLFLTILGSWNIVGQMLPRFWIGVFFGGIIVVLMVSFKLLSYRGGGTIATKKLVMNSSLLVAATLSGVLIYGEPLGVGKILGILGFIVSFVLIDDKTREYVVARLAMRPKVL